MARDAGRQGQLRAREGGNIEGDLNVMSRETVTRARGRKSCKRGMVARTPDSYARARAEGRQKLVWAGIPVLPDQTQLARAGHDAPIIRIMLHSND